MSGDRTISFVFRPSFAYDSATARMYFQWKYDADNYIYLESPGDTSLTMGYNAANTLNSAGTAVVFSSGDLLVVDCVVNKTGDEIRWYVNGVSKASDAAPSLGTMVTSASTLYIGSTVVPDEYNNGVMGEFSVNNRAFSAQESLHNYKLLKGRYD